MGSNPIVSKYTNLVYNVNFFILTMKYFVFTEIKKYYSTYNTIKKYIFFIIRLKSLLINLINKKRIIFPNELKKLVKYKILLNTLYYFKTKIVSIIYKKKQKVFSYFIKKKYIKKKKIIQRKFLFYKKKKERKKLDYVTLSDSLLIKKKIIHRNINKLLSMEQKKKKLYDIRGKYSSDLNYSWIIPYLSGINSIEISNQLFDYKKYFKKNDILTNIKKKTNTNKIFINFFEKSKIVQHVIKNDSFLFSNMPMLFYKNKLFSLYLYGNTAKHFKNKFDTSLSHYGLNSTQIETPSRFFLKYKKKSHIHWK